MRDARRLRTSIIVGDGPFRREAPEAPRGAAGHLHRLPRGRAARRGRSPRPTPSSSPARPTPGATPRSRRRRRDCPWSCPTSAGPCELMEDGVTGLKVAGSDVGRAARMPWSTLMDPATRARMGQQARAFVEANRVDEPFTAILDSDAYRAQLQRREQSRGEARRLNRSSTSRLTNVPRPRSGEKRGQRRAGPGSARRRVNPLRRAPAAPSPLAGEAPVTPRSREDGASAARVSCRSTSTTTPRSSLRTAPPESSAGAARRVRATRRDILASARRTRWPWRRSSRRASPTWRSSTLTASLSSSERSFAVVCESGCSSRRPTDGA